MGQNQPETGAAAFQGEEKQAGAPGLAALLPITAASWSVWRNNLTEVGRVQILKLHLSSLNPAWVMQGLGHLRQVT